MQFDDKFFQDIGLGSASDEERAEMINRLAELVQSRLGVRLANELTEEQLAEFDRLLETEGDTSAFAYIEQVHPGYHAMVQEEIDRAKQELASSVQQVAAKLDASE